MSIVHLAVHVSLSPGPDFMEEFISQSLVCEHKVHLVQIIPFSFLKQTVFPCTKLSFYSSTQVNEAQQCYTFRRPMHRLNLNEITKKQTLSG